MVWLKQLQLDLQLHPSLSVHLHIITITPFHLYTHHSIPSLTSTLAPLHCGHSFLGHLSGTIFIASCFLLELVGGMGNAMFQTSIYTHVSMLFRDHYGLSMVSIKWGGCSICCHCLPFSKGLMEVAAGLGYAAGPPVGGALYEVGPRGLIVS